MEISGPPVEPVEKQVLSESLRDQFPTPEDWVALQGGKPRVFRNPDQPNSPWLVIHVYEEHGDEARRFQSGAIVETLPENTSTLIPKGVPRTVDGHIVMRDIIVPSFMDRNVHGDVCEDRSVRAGGSRYEKIRFQREYENKIKELQDTGFEELRFGITADGFKLIPLPKIRDARPLFVESADE